MKEIIIITAGAIITFIMLIIYICAKIIVNLANKIDDLL